MLAAIDDPAFLLVLGFFLTSVLGGALAYSFQDRTWKHQLRAQQRDQRREQAMKVFEEVSSLLDKRLYRMRLLFWAAKRCAPAGRDSTGLREALDEYRQVVAEWNDNLNRTLALVHTYFGGRARERLEDHLYEEYSAAGRQLDQFVRDVSVPGHADISVPPLGRRLNWLGREVYALNLQLFESLDNDELGPEAPASDRAWRSATPLLQFGNQGTDTQKAPTGPPARGQVRRPDRRQLRQRNRGRSAVIPARGWPRRQRRRGHRGVERAALRGL